VPDVRIIGGGLAGSEAAWQAAELGCSVELVEMRPTKQTPAHHTDSFAELVCSNSLGNRSLETASGLLKEELRHLGSVILRCADANAVPAGGALGVAREDFPRAVTEAVHAHPNINVLREEATDLPDSPPRLARRIHRLPRLPLRQGRGCLPELPDDQSAVPRLRRGPRDRR